MTRRLTRLLLLVSMLALPIGAWAEDYHYPIIVGGVQVTTANAANVLDDAETPTVVYDAENHKLSLSDDASVGQITYSGTSNLTIAFSGTCSITTEETYAIQYTGSESDRPKLTFSLTNETGSLSINGESFVIKGFSDVDFGNLNLASTYAQGVYYDTDDFLMRGHDTPPRDLTITTETYYPIWIYDPSLSNTGYSHTQLSGESTIEIGEGTVSFDGNHTITISNINFHYEGNTLIVVGPSMTELTVNLVGESTATNCSVLSLWDTTPLTFTTSESAPGSLTGNDIVSWNNFGNGQIAYQNGLKVFYDVENSYKKTISTTGTYLKIGNTEVSATGDITIAEGTAHFDASSNTLTLTGATIDEQGAAESTDIQVLVDDLIIEISGTNTINGNITYNGSNYQSSNIEINKASNAESASLTVTNVEGFSSCTWGDGLYLSALDAQGATIDVHYEPSEGEGGSMQSYYGEGIADVIFSTTGTNAIWVAGNMSTGGDITGTGIEGTVTYNANDRILTIENASISTNDNYPSPLIVCNGDLTVNLVGRDNNVYFNGYYGTYIFKNNASTGTLTFTGTGSFSLNTDFSEGTYIGLCDGFSTVDFGDLAYTINADTKYITPLDISTPMMNVYEGKIEFITNGYLFGSTTYYKIVYADGSGNGEEVPLTNFDWSNFNEKITISELTGPCTVYAYTKYKEETGASAKAKLFGVADKTIALNSTTLDSELNVSDFVIVPENDATADGVSLINLTILESDNSSVVEYSQGTDKWTVKGLGVADLTVSAAVEGESNITILNQNGEVVTMTANVKVVPAAPTLTSNSTYIGDPITITTDVEGGTIYYSWDETDNVGTLYDETAPVAQNGTLYAWVSYYDATSKQTLIGPKAQQAFEVVNNIANAVIEGLAESATYTGAAITPSFTVKASAEAEGNLTAGTDYTVSYKQGDDAVESMIDAGSYKIMITGIGSYGGTQEVAFNITQATPIITFAQESYSAVLGEEFSSPATVDNWEVTPWQSSNEEVAIVADGVITLVGVGTTTITVTYAETANYNSTTASYQLVVSRALDVAFVGSNSWASYYATENLAVPEGLTAYIVSGVNGTSGVVTVQQVDYIPADNGVLLQREANGAADGYVAAPYTGTTSTFTNLLQGSASEVAVSSLASSPVYVLYNDKFKRATSGTIPARRAFLPLAVAPAGAPQLMTLNVIDGISTGISTLAADDNDGSWYTLDGLKLGGNPQRKGIYIKNGKKVFFNNK